MKAEHCIGTPIILWGFQANESARSRPSSTPLCISESSTD
eukprot:CAMPEP_0182889718 /NCGR_PEP_ID=MMETSP0034_2-20130328/22214_1 /TAXON_ID=156128 /ORGANISM="Nephroselmis pyriformis, Strain CCMP717" /LENGTH=39 /DNA_ID= /DNA_START= /DNA_END= /DNA_ORIENTATION=